MKHSQPVVISFLLLLTPVRVVGQSTEAAERAIYRQNIPEMIAAANTSAENDRAIADALCLDFDLSIFSYEQLRCTWQPLAKSELVAKILSEAVAQKEIEIYNELRDMTAEECAAYMKAFPQRKEVIRHFLANSILANTNELSLLELIYYDDWMPKEYHGILSDEITRRKSEIQQVLKNNVNDYNDYEIMLAQHLKYIVEYTLWTYFVEGHKELNKAYAQIAMVPDDAFEAARQYQQLAKGCFPAQQIRHAVQGQVDKFCAEINKSRDEYFSTMGNSQYKKLTYTVPEFKLNIDAPITPLFGISEARECFIRNREDISTGTSVLGWIFGGVVGLVAQGIGDWMAIDGLVESEYTARKEYMESVQNNLINTFKTYSDKIIRGIDQSLIKNHN